ncbi:UDP-3-O-[3-hydroxymyristoyl] N-acetylglucosamine deacetylase [Zavarzinia compransoris]|uniref:UDP-3-O-acyl-N-acetylglucosamine deacetylase n=1 Tax=Zavarzinia compransoris TaxID=1264899 RepID=A0A317DTT1_9PROT|nr:UDP-3-O-[3-hydroxymyristoyl] N-acetylglucosamine deacetylase [Zavarzinia compransoris]
MVLQAQKTVAAQVHLDGVGLHTGQPVRVTLLPAPSDHGILFRRSDVTDRDNVIPAQYDHVRDTTLCTVLVNGAGVSVRTVEHLMAAFAGLDIDNVIVEVSGPELPILDGSAAPFVAMIERVGTKAQRPPRRAIKILKRIEARIDDKLAALEPGEGFAIDFEIDFASRAIDRRQGSYTITPDDFGALLSGARTFGFRQEVEFLRSKGLALGGSLENAVVVDGDEIMNPEGLRFADEFVRHKALDALGDLYLAGAPIIGRFTGFKSGHALNNRLLHMLFADRTAWTYVAAVEDVEPQAGATWTEASVAAPF